MAHKHNRRRIRHRSRRNQYEHDLPTVWEIDGYHNISSLSEACLSVGSSHSSRESTASPEPLSQDYSLLATRPGNLATRPTISTHSISTLEARAMQTFGGEPGEDYSLVGKMQDMFDSMEWVDD